MKRQFITLFLILTIGSSYAQNVVIPDAIFFNRLKYNDSINTNKDNVITIAEAEAFSGTINVSGYNIKSLAGIEAFINIIGLDCSNNLLDTLDVGKSLQLKTLKCYNNKLKQLDLSNNIKLTFLICSGNLYTSFDFSANVELEKLFCGENSLLTSINVTKCDKLKILGVENTSITNLNISGNKQLKYLYCSRNNLLTSLDLQHNSLLELLYCNNNQLKKLDISKNTRLWNLNCSHNDLDSLDLTHNDSLETLSCVNNKIKTLDLSNKPFLWNLYCSSNQLSTLDISNNCKLEFLRCSNNPITGIKTSACDTLVYQVECDSTLLKNNLDLKHLKGLGKLYARNIQADSIDIKFNQKLAYLYIDNNNLTSVDLPSQYLNKISCNKNKIESINVAHLTALEQLYCDSNQLKKLNVGKTKEVLKLTHLSCRGNDSLKVICVNDTAYASSNPNFFKDSAAVYSQDCALGIEEATGHTSTILVYPNPSNGLFYISHISNNVYDAMVYNTMGSRLLEIKSQKGAKELDLSKHPNGIYLLQIQTAEGGMYYQKLVKE